MGATTSLDALLARAKSDFGDAEFAPPSQRRRDKLWELSTNLHCSIIGTCLSTADLRSLLAKLGDPTGRTGSEHDLHGQAVNRAGRKDEGGKLLHKLLDRRHEREIARFARVDTADAVRRLWREAVSNGDLPGSYWAVLTHPATDRSLVQEAFGEVHMLSHLVGRSVRADLRRMSGLEAEFAMQADRIVEQDTRIRELMDEKVALTRQLAERAAARPAPRSSGLDDLRATLELQAATIVRMKEQLARAETHARAEEGRRVQTERALRAMADQIRVGSQSETDLRREVDRLEEIVADHLGAAGQALPCLEHVTLLYVGGRPRQVAQARLLVGGLGGRLLTHDGGLEDSPTLLAGLAAQADAVLFPVDCVSHDAVGSLKRSCRERDIPLLPLRKASLAALLSAVASLRPAGCASDGREPGQQGRKP